MTKNSKPAEIWDDLLPIEQHTLRNIADDSRTSVPLVILEMFEMEGLVKLNFVNGEGGNYLTDLGRQVLAQADTAQPVTGAGEAALEAIEWAGQPLPADVDYDLRTIEGDGGEISWARAYILEQNRIIQELYSGKHGSIPHPAETWKAGLWEVYKLDEYQCHGERVGDVGELVALREQVARLTKALKPFADAYKNVTELDDDDSIVDDVMLTVWKVGDITAGDLIRAKIAFKQAAARLDAGEETEDTGAIPF